MKDKKSHIDQFIQETVSTEETVTNTELKESIFTQLEAEGFSPAPEPQSVKTSVKTISKSFFIKAIVGTIAIASIVGFIIGWHTSEWYYNQEETSSPLPETILDVKEQLKELPKAITPPNALIIKDSLNRQTPTVNSKITSTNTPKSKSKPDKASTTLTKEIEAIPLDKEEKINITSPEKASSTPINRELPTESAVTITPPTEPTTIDTTQSLLDKLKNKEKRLNDNLFTD